MIRENSDIISYHSFMFPFRWDIASIKRTPAAAPRSIDEINYRYEDRLNVETFKKTLCAGGSWGYTPFAVTEAGHYNEYTYFYPHARKAIFNTDQVFAKGSITYCFSYNDPEARYYNIYTTRESDLVQTYLKQGKQNNIDIFGNKLEVFHLKIKKIFLKIYDTGVGILQFDLMNCSYTDPNDILIINDFGRRIYPPFLGSFEIDSANRGVSAPIGAVYPFCIDINSRRAALPTEESVKDLFYYNAAGRFDPSNNQSITQLPEFIQTRLGSGFNTRLTRIDKGDILLTPVIDDRMFVLCVYDDTRTYAESSLIDSEPVPDDFWYQFLFVDGKGKGVANPSYEKELIEKHSYPRWSEGGTCYGMSRYSFVAWIKSRLDSGASCKLVKDHCATLYNEMVLLVLTQRASIIRFSEEIAYVSTLENKELDQQNLDDIKNLYKHYIRFVNKVYFNEVTAQEQGIEMYAMMQEQMKIRENLADLRQEISELHTYAELSYEKNRANRADRLTILAALFLVPTFITGFFGMNTFNSTFFDYYSNIGLVSFLQCPVTGYAVYGLLFVMMIVIVLYAGCSIVKSGLFKKHR